MMSAATEYSSRHASELAKISATSCREDRIASARLVVAALVAAVVISRWTHLPLSLWVALPLLLAFVALVTWHGSLKRARLRALRTAAFYCRGLERIQGTWAGGGQSGEHLIPEHHPYAVDLDIFGRGSLFELISSARTRMGEQTLAHWLLYPADAQEIAERQSCVQEMRDRLDLREDLDSAGAEGVGVRPDSLTSWAESPNRLQDQWIRVAAVVLPLLFIAACTCWAVVGIRWPLMIVLLADVAVLVRLRQAVQVVASSTESAFDNLRLLHSLLARIEGEEFETAALQSIKVSLTSRGQSASRTVSELCTIADFSGQRKNGLVRILLELPMLYSIQVALRAEAWRSKHAPAIRAWLSAIGRFEALSSIAMYAYEHDSDPFPDIVTGAATFEAQALGHPLLSLQTCIRNDVSILHPIRTILISGSNMSGKSTLLRSIGTNTVLAMAGAPVRASSLRLTTLQVGASIRISDSLAEGHSKFYAEVARLRDLYLLSANSIPLLFLLDEVLQGTNSKDRRIGAEGILRAFVRRGAIGLISTHDLALTEFTNLPPEAIHNVHFQDTLKDGKMTFDYRLQEGIVTKSNGVELMRSMGLDV